MTNPCSMELSRRLSVLLLVKGRDPGTTGPPIIDRDYSEDTYTYIESLSAFNIPYETLSVDHVDSDTFRSGNRVNYVAVVLTTSSFAVSDETVRILEEASRSLGISMVASCLDGDERMASLFGVEKFFGTSRGWTQRMEILEWPGEEKVDGKPKALIDLGFRSAFFGARKSGYGRIDYWKAAGKLVRMARKIAVPYRLVKIRPKAMILAQSKGGSPLVWSFPSGKAVNYSIALAPEAYLGGFSRAQSLFRKIIETNSGFGLVSADLENSMVLRLDDPGACCHTYLDTKGVLDEHEWRTLGRELKEEGAHISIAYTPAWVDDGDSDSGRLMLDGTEVNDRFPGRIYESARVCYLPKGKGSAIYDHVSEFKGLQGLSSYGEVSIESHGMTHLDPDRKGWLASQSNRRDRRWYHEFYHVPKNADVDPNVQRGSLRASRQKIQELFGKPPIVLVPSGHRHGEVTDILAWEEGYLLFSSDYTGILRRDQIIRNRKIPSLFLSFKDPFDPGNKGGMPFVGIVHDYEIRRKGVGWIRTLLKRWRSSGVRRFLSIRELAIHLTSKIEVEMQPSESCLRMRLELPKSSIGEREGNMFHPITLRFRAILPYNFVLESDPIVASGSATVFLEKDIGRKGVLVNLHIDSPDTVHVAIPFRHVEMTPCPEIGCGLS